MARFTSFGSSTGLHHPTGPFPDSPKATAEDTHCVDFSCPVRSEQSNDLAGKQLQADIPDRAELPEETGYACHSDQWLHRLCKLQENQSFCKWIKPDTAAELLIPDIRFKPVNASWVRNRPILQRHKTVKFFLSWIVYAMCLGVVRREIYLALQ